MWLIAVIAVPWHLSWSLTPAVRVISCLGVIVAVACTRTADVQAPLLASAQYDLVSASDGVMNDVPVST
jgi:hypothetical protein